MGFDHEIGGGFVDGHRDVVDLGDSHQGFYVWVVGLGGQGVGEEDDEIDDAFHDFGSDLLVAA